MATFSSYGRAAVLPPTTRPGTRAAAPANPAVQFVTGMAVAPTYGTTGSGTGVSLGTQPDRPSRANATFIPLGDPRNPYTRPGHTNGSIPSNTPGVPPTLYDPTKPASPGPGPGGVRPPTTGGGGTTPPPTTGGGGTTPPPTTGGGTTNPPGGGNNGGGMPMPGANPTTNIGANPYLSSLLGGSPGGGFADQYTENQQGTVITSPDLLGRGVLRQMGMDPNSGYGALIANDAQAVSPLVAYLLSQSGQADNATTLNSIGQLLQNRAQAGGRGAIDETALAQVLNPNSAAARTMLGVGGNGISDLAPEQQMDSVNRYLGAAIDLGLNPYMGQATANWINSAGSDYQERIAMGGAQATDPYYQYLKARGLDTMFSR